MSLPLLLLLGNTAGVLLAESPADGASLLGSEVERKVLLLGVELAERVALVGVDDGQGAGDRLAEVVAIRENLSAPFLFHSREAAPLFLHSGEF